MTSDPQITTRDDLITHIYRMLEDDPSGWENTTAQSFLQALAAWLISCRDYYENINSPVDVETPTWQIFADSLTAATVYE